MKSWILQWNLSRIIRLALGILLLVHGIGGEEWLLAILGGFLTLMPILNFGCGGISCNSVSCEEKSLSE